MAYEIKEGEAWTDNRNGPRLENFGLEKLEVNNFIEIPLKVNAKGKAVPERGINLKAANEKFKPKEFKKRRYEDGGKYGLGFIKVQRVK